MKKDQRLDSAFLKPELVEHQGTDTDDREMHGGAGDLGNIDGETSVREANTYVFVHELPKI